MAKAYFALLEVLCNNHPSSVIEMETPVFTQLVVSMQEGLKSLGILRTDSNNEFLLTAKIPEFAPKAVQLLIT